MQWCVYPAWKWRHLKSIVSSGIKNSSKKRNLALPSTGQRAQSGEWWDKEHSCFFSSDVRRRFGNLPVFQVPSVKFQISQNMMAIYVAHWKTHHSTTRKVLLLLSTFNQTVPVQRIKAHFPFSYCLLNSSLLAYYLHSLIVLQYPVVYVQSKECSCAVQIESTSPPTRPWRRARWIK